MYIVFFVLNIFCYIYYSLCYTYIFHIQSSVRKLTNKCVLGGYSKQKSSDMINLFDLIKAMQKFLFL